MDYLGRPRYLPHASSTVKASSSVTSRPPQSVSQSQPGSRSTSPHSMRSSHYLSSTTRTPTNARSRIPIGSNGGSRISSRESSPGRTRTYNSHSDFLHLSGLSNKKITAPFFQLSILVLLEIDVELAVSSSGQYMLC